MCWGLFGVLRGGLGLGGGCAADVGGSAGYVAGSRAAAGFDDVTLAQAQITKQSSGALVDQLEAAGYVTREPDPADGRARLVRVAPRGAVAVKASVAHVGKRRMAELRRTLSALREVADPYR